MKDRKLTINNSSNPLRPKEVPSIPARNKPLNMKYRKTTSRSVDLICRFEMTEATEAQVQQLVAKVDAELKLQFGTTYNGLEQAEGIHE